LGHLAATVFTLITRACVIWQFSYLDHLHLLMASMPFTAIAAITAAPAFELRNIDAAAPALWITFFIGLSSALVKSIIRREGWRFLG